MPGGTLTSSIQKPVTHPIKGQVKVNLVARIVDMRIIQDAKVEYNGQEYTGGVLMVPEFSYTIGGQKFVDQMAPSQFVVPFSVFDLARKTAVTGQSFSNVYPERTLEEAVLVLRALIDTYFKDENDVAQPLYGLAKSQWTYAI